jgi:cell division septum initiation protein DivIVA
MSDTPVPPPRPGSRPGPAAPTDDQGAPETAIDSVHDVLDELLDIVEGARSMPMSASCVINRAQVLSLLDDVRSGLPAAMDQAQEVLGDRSAVVEDGHREAERIVGEAHEERRRLLEQTDILREAQAESQRILEQARAQSEGMRLEVEDYVDAKLANFEIVLSKTLEAVERGRQKLAGQHELDDLAEPVDEEPFPG